MRKKIIIGNWKMHKNMKETQEFINEFKNLINNKKTTCDYGIAASFTNLNIFKENNLKDFIIAAQNCHFEKQGAFTGEISTNMLEELNVSHVIIGHSERRQYFNETDETINKKLMWIFSQSQIVPVLCCGESLAQYEANQTKSVITQQVTAALKGINSKDASKLVIAYEPIWAIGTGKTATVAQAQEACLEIRKVLTKLYDEKTANSIRIQYGGSVKPDNVKDLLAQPDIDGALVGGASLQVTDFINLLI